MVEPGKNVNIRSNAGFLIHKSNQDEGLESTQQDADNFINAICDDPDAICYVAYLQRYAYDEATPAGVVVCLWHAEESAPAYEVRNLYVLPEFRSKKIANRLIQAVVDWCGEANYPVYITTNGEPRPFYKALGFQPVRQICGTTIKDVRAALGGSNVRNLQSGEVR